MVFGPMNTNQSADNRVQVYEDIIGQKHERHETLSNGTYRRSQSRAQVRRDGKIGRFECKID